MKHLTTILLTFASVAFGSIEMALAVTNVTVPTEWTRVDRELAGPAPTMLHAGLPLVAPRGIALDAAEDTLWVGDPGSATEASRIVRFPVVGSTVGSPAIFYSDPSVLIQAKWAIPTELDSQEVLIVADQGENAPDGSFTGVGAKVLSIPVLPGDIAGVPAVIWSGAPFVCPTGVMRLGDSALVTDPCAGPMVTRPDDPSATQFPASILFALKLDGSAAPISLHVGSPFTSMIGICPFVPGTVLVNDTDAGRLDPTSTGGRPGFAPPAGAEKFFFRIVSSGTFVPQLTAPRRAPIYEEGPFAIHVSGLPPGSPIRVDLLGDHFIVGRLGGIAPTKTRIYSAADLDVNEDLVINVASSTAAPDIDLSVETDDSYDLFEVPKDDDQSNLLVDNKHAGAKPRPSPSLTSIYYDRFTVDQGAAAVWIYPEEGSTPVRIAQGGVIDQPLSGQLSPNHQEIWIVDKAAASLYSVPFPSSATFDALFPYRGQFGPNSTLASIPAIDEWAYLLAVLLVFAAAVSVGVARRSRRGPTIR